MISDHLRRWATSEFESMAVTDTKKEDFYSMKQENSSFVGKYFQGVISSQGASPDSLQDVAQIFPQRRIVAVADGAGDTGGSAGDWARILTLCFGSKSDSEDSKTWLSRSVATWGKIANLARLSDSDTVLSRQELNILRKGVDASFIGGTFLELDGKLCLEWVAAGDCEVFLIRGCSLEECGPMSKSEDFKSTAWSLNSQNPNIENITTRTWELKTGDTVLFCTDALAQLVHRAFEQSGNSKWVPKEVRALIQVESWERLRELTLDWRSSKTLRNDDIAFVRVDVMKNGSGSDFFILSQNASQSKRSGPESETHYEASGEHDSNLLSPRPPATTTTASRSISPESDTLPPELDTAGRPQSDQVEAGKGSARSPGNSLLGSSLLTRMLLILISFSLGVSVGRILPITHLASSSDLDPRPEIDTGSNSRAESSSAAPTLSSNSPRVEEFSLEERSGAARPLEQGSSSRPASAPASDVFPQNLVGKTNSERLLEVGVSLYANPNGEGESYPLIKLEFEKPHRHLPVTCLNNTCTQVSFNCWLRKPVGELVEESGLAKATNVYLEKKGPFLGNLRGSSPFQVKRNSDVTSGSSRDTSDATNDETLNSLDTWLEISVVAYLRDSDV